MIDSLSLFLFILLVIIIFRSYVSKVFFSFYTKCNSYFSDLTKEIGAEKPIASDHNALMRIDEDIKNLGIASDDIAEIEFEHKLEETFLSL
ncbi:MAG: hypothetical protein VX335_02290 [Pseudomonadota bacterium]|nr:hypothetical protein [Pseudomonadota bacterium]